MMLWRGGNSNPPGSHGVLGASLPAPRLALLKLLGTALPSPTGACAQAQEQDLGRSLELQHGHPRARLSICARFGVQKAKPPQNKLFAKGFHKTRTRAFVVLIPILKKGGRFWGGWNPTQWSGQFAFQLKSPGRCCRVQDAEPWHSIPLHHFHRKKTIMKHDHCSEK